MLLLKIILNYQTRHFNLNLVTSHSIHEYFPHARYSAKVECRAEAWYKSQIPPTSVILDYSTNAVSPTLYSFADLLRVKNGGDHSIDMQ